MVSRNVRVRHYSCFFFLLSRRPQKSTRLTHSIPARRSADDTGRHATKDWSRFRRWRAKALMMLLVTSRFWPKRVKGMKALLKQDGLTGWRVTARIWWYLLGTPGVLRKSFFPWLSYFMPGFHPWNHDDRSLIGKYE